jgi:hypothetical protein
MSGIPTPSAILSLIVRWKSSCLTESKELVGVGTGKEVGLELEAGRGALVGVSVTVAVTVGCEDSLVDSAVVLDSAAEDSEVEVVGEAVVDGTAPFPEIENWCE